MISRLSTTHYSSRLVQEYPVPFNSAGQAFYCSSSHNSRKRATGNTIYVAIITTTVTRAISTPPKARRGSIRRPLRRPGETGRWRRRYASVVAVDVHTNKAIRFGPATKHAVGMQSVGYAYELHTQVSMHSGAYLLEGS